MKGKITELFESVQGEGIYFGERQLFVRFFGCNLNCKFCDTKPDYFMEYYVPELFEKIKAHDHKYRFLSFTGGEPLLQKDFLKSILKLTCENGFKNYLETNGTMPDELAGVIEYLDIIAMDLKLPSSTAMIDFWHEHRKFLEIASKKDMFLKAVVCKDTTEGDLIKAINLIKETGTSAVLVLQPNSYEDGIQLRDKLERFRGICARDGVVTCIIPQMHKVIGAQ